MTSSKNVSGTTIQKPSESLIFMWWNTSLSPHAPGHKGASKEKFLIGSQIIDSLINDLHVDCLSLGEVKSPDLVALSYSLGPAYAVFDCNEVCNLPFNTGVIYRKDKLHYLGKSCIEAYRHNRSFKVATRADFLAGNTVIHLFVSHWSSRLHRSGGEARSTFGNELRMAIEEVNNLYADKTAYCILLGDFNDEPYDLSLAEALSAQRSREQIRADNSFLYNPFWRRVGETNAYVPGVIDESNVGTYHHKSGEYTKWRTFDQMIFSAPFISGGDWELNEKYTQIVREPYSKIISNSSFDHYPIMSVIQRRTNNG